MRELFWTKAALEDLAYWQRHDPKKVRRMVELCLDACKHPSTGKGKPEPLKFQLAGCWSRRIDQEHRLVYRFDDDKVVVLQARYHYGR